MPAAHVCRRWSCHRKFTWTNISSHVLDVSWTPETYSERTCTLTCWVPQMLTREKELILESWRPWTFMTLSIKDFLWVAEIEFEMYMLTTAIRTYLWIICTTALGISSLRYWYAGRYGRPILKRYIQTSIPNCEHTMAVIFRSRSQFDPRKSLSVLSGLSKLRQYSSQFVRCQGRCWFRVLGRPTSSSRQSWCWRSEEGHCHCR